MLKNKLAIFASGTGTNAEAIMTWFKDHDAVEVVMVLSNNPHASVLEKAKRFGVTTRAFTREQFRDSDEVVRWLKDAGVTHIVLAGFLWLVPPSLIDAWPKRIINIHPSLLPKYSGKGMYGMKVHEAVRAGLDLETGITIHLVDGNYDEGEIIFQTTCPVDAGESTEEIASKVRHLEHANYPGVIEKWVEGTK